MGLLSSAPYLVSFDAATIRRIGALANTAPIFARYFTTAMAYSVNIVSTRAKQNTAARFVQPTGNLMRSIEGHVLSPYTGVVGVGQQVPYARRRELGFSGMTDVLGRYYPVDTGAFYLHDALEASRPDIAVAFRTATAFAIRDIII